MNILFYNIIDISFPLINKLSKHTIYIYAKNNKIKNKYISQLIKKCKLSTKIDDSIKFIHTVNPENFETFDYIFSFNLKKYDCKKYPKWYNFIYTYDANYYKSNKSLKVNNIYIGLLYEYDNILSDFIYTCAYIKYIPNININTSLLEENVVITHIFNDIINGTLKQNYIGDYIITHNTLTTLYIELDYVVSMISLKKWINKVSVYYNNTDNIILKRLLLSFYNNKHYDLNFNLNIYQNKIYNSHKKEHCINSNYKKASTQIVKNNSWNLLKKNIIYYEMHNMLKNPTSSVTIKNTFILLLIAFLIYYGHIMIILIVLYPKILLLNYFILKIPIQKIISKLFFLAINNCKETFGHRILYDMAENEYNFTNKQYIKCMMPHGFFPYGAGLLYNDEYEKKISFNLEKNNICVSGILSHIPIISNICKSLNVSNVNFSSLSNIINKGNSIIIFPGGVQETFGTDINRETIIIKKRKGIFRLALEKNISMIPIYTFGITQTYNNIKLFKDPIYNTKIKFPIGKFGLIYPNRVNIVTVVGKPIYIPSKIKNIVTDDSIKTLRNIYIKRVKQLYNKYKDMYNWNNKSLHIL